MLKIVKEDAREWCVSCGWLSSVAVGVRRLLEYEVSGIQFGERRSRQNEGTSSLFIYYKSRGFVTLTGLPTYPELLATRLDLRQTRAEEKAPALANLEVRRFGDEDYCTEVVHSAKVHC